ncbi:hypothetical protein HYX14_01685 [Candidatus Woesearchaeota archaeon]|nr:hypothetical protein [Candidatus Woesearchaeota archaeon]
MNKRGDVMAVIIATVATLTAFILITMTIVGFQAKADEKAAENLCRNSIAFRAQATVSGTALSPVLCKTIDKKISGDRQEIKDQLAYLMARCWWMMGEGKYEEILANPELIRKALGVHRGENDCFLCYTALIDEKEIDGGLIPTNEMWNYLAEKDHRQIKGKKYIDYIQNYGGPGTAAVMSPIAPQEAYGIVFMAKNAQESGSGYWWSTPLAALSALGATICIATVACIPAGLALTFSTGFFVTSAAGAAYRDFYGSDERDVSMVTLDHLKAIETGGCIVKDLGGE